MTEAVAVTAPVVVIEAVVVRPAVAVIDAVDESAAVSLSPVVIIILLVPCDCDPTNATTVNSPA